MDWTTLTASEQHELFLHEEIVPDIEDNPHKIQFVKGCWGKRCILTYIINFHNKYTLETLSIFYNYCHCFDFSDSVYVLLNDRDFDEETNKCSKEFFKSLIPHIDNILIDYWSTYNFLNYFKNFLTKEVIIEINNNLPKDFKEFDLFYDWIRFYYGKEFKEQLEFVKRLKGEL